MELVNSEQAAELLEKAKQEVEAEAKRQQEREAVKDKSDDAARQGAAAGPSRRGGGVDREGLGVYGFSGGLGIDAWLSMAQQPDPAPDEPNEQPLKHPDDAVFETLNDGSTALIVPPGKRLKLDLSAILEGGDARRAEREKRARKRKKRRGRMWGGFLGGGGGEQGAWKGSFKEWMNEYTVTMDIKVQDELPGSGVALIQTALVHAGSGHRNMRGKLVQSEGEALVSSAGGVGVLGTFGDVTKARVRPNRWHRVAVSVKCTDDAKVKGEVLTWVDATSGAVVRSEAVTCNGRFAIDPSALFLFSSAQPAMMNRTIAVRTVRVVARASDDACAKADLARDRVISMFNLEREQEVDEQRQGLSLAPLFAKPRPLWAAPALVGTFGDPFIEGTIFEGSSCLAWSFQVPCHYTRLGSFCLRTRPLTSFARAAPAHEIAPTRRAERADQLPRRGRHRCCSWLSSA